MYKNIDKSVVLRLADEVNYSSGQVSSKTIAQNEHLSITIFAFDKGEGLSPHTATGDAMVVVLDGEVKITIDGAENFLKSGDSIVMPANIIHSLDGINRFKMMLTVVQPV